MRDLTNRCIENEIMDDPLLPEEALTEALKDISFVNKCLGGNSITVKAVEHLINLFPKKKTWTLADIGCGDGEMLRILSDYFEKKNISVTFTGIDISEKGVERGRNISKEYKNITFLNENILDESISQTQFDITICTLTLHHIKEDQIVPFLQGIKNRSQYGIIINDLERSKIAYQLFSIFSRIFINSPTAKNDGLVSIASGFKKKDLEKYSQHLGLKKYSITWKWAFRYLWYIRLI